MFQNDRIFDDFNQFEVLNLMLLAAGLIHLSALCQQYIAGRLCEENVKEISEFAKDLLCMLIDRSILKL